MQLSDNQKKAVGYFLLGSIIVIYLFLSILPSTQKTALNFISLFGTYATLYGLIIAYIQIKSIKELNIITLEAVDKAINRMNTMFSVSEISKAERIIQEIQGYIFSNKFELALLRMKDLKEIMIKIKYNGDLVEYTNTQIYHEQITGLSIDINNLSNHILGIKKGISFVTINENLESLSTVLNEFENKLKYS